MRYRQRPSLVIWFAGTMALALGIGREPSAIRAADSVASPDVESILAGSVPGNSSDLRAMQAHVQSLVQRVLPATVAVRVGAAQGSGVIISPDGYVLTAAHVVGRPGRQANLVFPDGRQVLGDTLGVFRTVDAGLVKIRNDQAAAKRAPWPHAPMGDSAKLKPGQWCLAVGHPGGPQTMVTPVVRLGRILAIHVDNAITTDCTLIGGDSGGPLFDMQGNVIGVNSRIGGPLTVNLHVPVHAYRSTWDRLLAGEAWGYVPGNRPYLGVQGEADSDAPKVARVLPDAPAEKAGVKQGDVVTKFGGKPVTTFQSLKEMVESEEPGARVELEVQRDGKPLRLQAVIGRQRD